MDHEGFGGFLSGECSPSEAARVAEMMAAIEGDAGDLEAVSAWLGWSGEKLTEWDAPTSEAFSDAYCGQWASGADYAEQSAEDMGAFVIGAEPYGGNPVDVSGQWPFTCIDWDRAWRELELGDGYAAIDDDAGGVYVFRPS